MFVDDIAYYSSTIFNSVVYNGLPFGSSNIPDLQQNEKHGSPETALDS